MKKQTIRYYAIDDYSDKPYPVLTKVPFNKQNSDIRSKFPGKLSASYINTGSHKFPSNTASFNSSLPETFRPNKVFVTAKKSVSVSTRSTEGYQSILGCSSDVIDEGDTTDRSGQMDWNNYHRLSVIYNFMNDLELNFPSICTVGSIGKSLEGRDIKVVKISNSQASNVSVWMDAGIHAREWIAPAVATYMANYIANNFDSLPANMMNKDWYILPVLNPDGYEYTHTNERLWRKNRAWWKGQCVGVDLNRNFSFGWGGKGSSDNPSNGFFRGSKPFSEPESNAVKNMLLNPKINFKIYLTLHSFGQVIIFPFACRDDLCPSYVRLLEGATAMSKAIYEKTGNIYKVGISKDVMYTASGTSNDFSHGVANIPFCYLIELRSKKHKFKLPKEEIAITCTEILSSIKALMEVVDRYDITRVLPDDVIEKCVSVIPSSAIPKMNTSLEFGGKLQKQYNIAKGNTKTKDDVTVNIWREEESVMDVMVEGQQRLIQIANMLHERDIPYSIALKDVNSLVQKEKEESFKKFTIRMDWRSYHRLNVIYDFMDRLAIEYPFLCKVNVIGKSVENRDIKMLKISNGDLNNEAVWIDGAIHPREWISVAVVTFLADKIVKRFSELPSSVTTKDWYIVPVLNPDGYEYTHTHDRMWRKNRARVGECVGVDLNRNFSVGWGEKGEEGSSEDPGSIYYRGTRAFSEPEVHAVKTVIRNIGTTFKVFLSFHSYGEVILFPWGYTSDACPNYVELLEGGIIMAKAIYETSGRIYKVGSTKDLMYYTAGNSIDWSYGKANIPYSYMVELRSKKHRFLLPKEEIIPTAKEITCAVMRLMDFVDSRSKSNSGPPK